METTIAKFESKRFKELDMEDAKNISNVIGGDVLQNTIASVGDVKLVESMPWFIAYIITTEYVEKFKDIFTPETVTYLKQNRLPQSEPAFNTPIMNVKKESPVNTTDNQQSESSQSTEKVDVNTNATQTSTEKVDVNNNATESIADSSLPVQIPQESPKKVDVNNNAIADFSSPVQIPQESPKKVNVNNNATGSTVDSSSPVQIALPQEVDVNKRVTGKDDIAQKDEPKLESTVAAVTKNLDFNKDVKNLTGLVRSDKKMKVNAKRSPSNVKFDIQNKSTIDSSKSNSFKAIMIFTMKDEPTQSNINTYFRNVVLPYAKSTHPNLDANCKLVEDIDGKILHDVGMEMAKTVMRVSSSKYGKEKIDGIYRKATGKSDLEGLFINFYRNSKIIEDCLSRFKTELKKLR